MLFIVCSWPDLLTVVERAPGRRGTAFQLVILTSRITRDRKFYGIRIIKSGLAIRVARSLDPSRLYVHGRAIGSYRHVLGPLFHDVIICPSDGVCAQDQMKIAVVGESTAVLHGLP